MLYKGDCLNCDEPPVVFLTQVVDGEMRQINLCRDCPHRQELEAEDTAGFALADLLARLAEKSGHQCASAAAAAMLPGQAGVEQVPTPATDGPSTACTCGMTAAEYQSSRRLGCPQCYHVFREELRETLQCSQTRGRRHEGKIPGNQRILRLRGEELRRELEEATRSEDYERAAHLRDLLRQWERGLRPPGH